MKTWSTRSSSVIVSAWDTCCASISAISLRWLRLLVLLTRKKIAVSLIPSQPLPLVDIHSMWVPLSYSLLCIRFNEAHGRALETLVLGFDLAQLCFDARKVVMCRA